MIFAVDPVQWATAFGLVVTSLLGVGTFMRQKRSATVASQERAATHSKVLEIDGAVNGKPPNRQSLADQVNDLHGDRPSASRGAQEGMMSTMQQILARLEVIERRSSGDGADKT